MKTSHIKEGSQAMISSTGQIVEVRRISNHGFSVVRFQTGGEYMIMSDRLESIDKEETKH